MKTNNYDMFVFRVDNREKGIDQSHVRALIQSIKARNLLELRPILVNKNMEIIDGQHRLMAAKELGVDIYYNVEKNLVATDIILMNTNKNWSMGDFLNFYVQNDYVEYKKLAEFMLKNEITLRVALNICMGNMHNVQKDFKQGKLIFETVPAQEDVELCRQTIAVIKKNIGFSKFIESGKFWKAMLLLFRHKDFSLAKWFNNLEKMIGRMAPKATTKDYCRLLMEIYNWHNPDRINILDEI